VGRVAVLPDTNIWRYIVDADAVERVRKAAKSHGIDLVACPAVVYECLRIKDPKLRRQLAKALTRPEWVRPMPEAYVECEDVRNEVARHRPDWMVPQPDLREWNRNRSDWLGGFWRRVRQQAPLMAKIIASLGDDELDQARRQAQDRRRHAIDLGHTATSLRLDSATARYLQPVPGWNGQEFEAWRGVGEGHWWHVLFVHQDETRLDWLAPWLDMRRIRADRAGWVEFWTREVSMKQLPREWIRWAMAEVQATRKVTSGTPVDNQISTYLPDFNIFVTGDRAFSEGVEFMRPSAPVPLARASLSPAGAAAVDHLLDLFRQLG
jgi:hypothetical protein